MTESAIKWYEERIFFYRFGLGPKGHYMPNLKGGARTFLKNRLKEQERALMNSAGLPSHQDACAAIGSSRKSRRIMRAELQARISHSIGVQISLHERLVYFWSNFFGINAARGRVSMATVGEWERNVVRPNIMGRFSDMLEKTVRHPAFIFSLDNQGSVSPASPYGRNSGSSFNENLGRELLEIYTVADPQLFNQNDVVSMSLAFTGWSFTSTSQARTFSWGGSPDRLGQFIFQSRWSHPTDLTIMGRRFSGTGEQRCRSIIDFLANHPSTAFNIAKRMCEHFISDTPPTSLINRLADRFIETGGNLYETTLALITSDEAWTLPLQKIRLPYETFVASCRAMDIGWHHSEMNPFLYAMQGLSNLPWHADTPFGFADRNMCWMTPNMIRIKSECFQAVVSRLYDNRKINIKPVSFARNQLRLKNADSTIKAIRRLRNRRKWALTCVFLSPEFNLR